MKPKAKLIKKVNSPAPPAPQPTGKKEPVKAGPAVDPRKAWQALFPSK